MIKTRKILDQVTPYQLPTIPRGNKIRLDLNENVKGCSPAVRKAINKAGSDDIAMYPEYQELIEKLAHYLRLVLDNILLTNGADEAIRCIMDCYIEKGEEVIIPVPNYSMFGILTQLRGAETKEVLYGNDFSFPLEDVFTTISLRTRLVVISNPNSLLGTSIKRSALIKILRKTQALGSVVLLDETYHHFAQRTFVDLRISWFATRICGIF
jgi:histidinol-phosphate aminotransferase